MKLSSPRRLRRILLRAGIALALLAAVAAAALFFGPFGFGPGSEDPESDVQLGRAVTVERGDLARVVSAVGNVAAAKADELAFEVNGKLARVLVAPGDVVESGQLLAELDAADLEQALLEAEESLESASLDHATLLDPPDPDDLLLAKLSLAEAEAALARLRDFEDPQTEVMLRSSLLTNERSLRQAQAKLTDLEGGATAEQIAAATARFQRAEASWLSERESYEDFLDGPSDLQLETARLTLKQAEEKLEDYRDSSRTTQTDIDLQELVVIEAREALAELEAPVSEAEKRRRAVSLAAAEQEYENARLQLLELTESDSEEIAVARIDYQAALLGMSSAQLALQDYQDGPAEHEITTAENAIVRRQIELRRLQEPPSKNVVRKSELGLAAARRRVDDAREQLAKTRLNAPYGGAITKADATIGVQPAAGFIAIQSGARPQIETRVTEIDVGKVAVGQAVTIEPDIFGSEEIFEGTVSSINPEPSSDAGLITYDLTIEFGSDPGSLLPGMTVALEIIIESRSNVIVIPLAALTEEDGRVTVEVVDPQTDLPAEREIEVGLRNEIEVEVLSGLSAGELVRTSLTGAEEIDLSFGPPDDEE
ncbi:MAG: efflux RND transporter periplasmic adaptor subunit [Chloroflexi bacterium]|nr:efflux RND transporter periplasmic adaptor subunit [Chloroflexota bacterium]MDE2701613.1 efflux RND transporter periplasmic adaptor subunit [Chloroflexota bacterium]MDE2862090.1 efflux RND transporter periplasmic adaptor subunit [Chloroflexota bacterium]MDE2936943.1 efflux RND transporter periplasmic adaptor subunit [Chloroflexota bacterium]MXY00967.1 efflux RND transporter periplasmic adaptor subunit [Chloroflexota bacterium]